MKFKIGDRVKSIDGSYEGRYGTVTGLCFRRETTCCYVLFDGAYLPASKLFNFLEKIRKNNMAKLICSDGKEINISAETEQELRAAFGKEKKYYKGSVFMGDINVVEYILVDIDGTLGGYNPRSHNVYPFGGHKSKDGITAKQVNGYIYMSPKHI